jgi:hypothetical protein
MLFVESPKIAGSSLQTSPTEVKANWGVLPKTSGTQRTGVPDFLKRSSSTRLVVGPIETLARVSRTQKRRADGLSAAERCDGERERWQSIAAERCCFNVSTGMEKEEKSKALFDLFVLRHRCVPPGSIEMCRMPEDSFSDRQTPTVLRCSCQLIKLAGGQSAFHLGSERSFVGRYLVRSIRNRGCISHFLAPRSRRWLQGFGIIFFFSSPWADEVAAEMQPSCRGRRLLTLGGLRKPAHCPDWSSRSW